MQFIVIQGPTNYYKDIIDTYGKYPNVVFSTLSNEPSENITELKNYFNVLVTNFDFNPGKGNLNCQTINTKNGLLECKKLGATSALKIRSDMTIDKMDIFLDILKNKSSLSFLAWHIDNYLIDYVNYGPIDDLINFWDIYEINNNFPEKNLIINYSKLVGEDINSFEIVRKYVTFFMDDLIKENININWLKYNINVSHYYKHSCYLY